MKMRGWMLAGTMALAAGCFTVKTESEVKPIHITLDINLKVDKEIDKAFSDENLARPQGQFARLKQLLDRQVAGLTREAMFEARSGATEADRQAIAEANRRRSQRFAEVAKSSGATLASVRQRSRQRFEEKLAAGCGVWLQREDGTWFQK